MRGAEEAGLDFASNAAFVPADKDLVVASGEVGIGMARQMASGGGGALVGVHRRTLIEVVVDDQFRGGGITSVIVEHAVVIQIDPDDAAIVAAGDEVPHAGVGGADMHVAGPRDGKIVVTDDQASG